MRSDKHVGQTVRGYMAPNNLISARYSFCLPCKASDCRIDVCVSEQAGVLPSIHPRLKRHEHVLDIMFLLY